MASGRYVGTDISTRALETVNELKRTLPQYQARPVVLDRPRGKACSELETPEG